jgi:serine/threonine-protein kinase PknG
MASIEGVTIDPLVRSRLTATVLETAMAIVRQGGSQPGVRIGGYQAQEAALRDGLEGTYRELATMATSSQERVTLVDLANTVRRWTLR